MTWWDFLLGVVIGILSNFATLGVLYVKRHWVAKELGVINWKLSGDVWWFCCDLHSIKLQADLGRPGKVREAIDAALRHAKAIGADKDAMSQVAALRGINPADKKTIQERVDAIIDNFGKRAISSQPGFKP
jgi:hypothetical protein